MTDAERGYTVLAQLAGRCTAFLKKTLTGFYVHGSLTLGCFSWERSDLDFLLVTEWGLTLEEKLKLVFMMMESSPVAPQKGIEMSVVRREDCANPCERPGFDLHFSPMHAARCAANPEDYCRSMKGRDPDLPAHFAMTRARGYALRGAAPERVFAPVPRKAMLASIRNDLEDGPGTQPGYFVLNLCRGLAYAREGYILSKAEGAAWAEPLYLRHEGVIRSARQWYTENGTEPDEAAAWKFYKETAHLLIDK